MLASFAGRAVARRGRALGLRGEPARPEALEPQPRLSVLHLVQSGTGGGQHPAGPGPCAQGPVLGVAPGVTLVSGPMNDTEFQSAHQMTPLGRSSSPEDIARAVRFLIESLYHDRHHAARRWRAAPLATWDGTCCSGPGPARTQGLTMPTALTHPQLLNCRRLFLQNYEVWINIGVHDFEKGEQRVLINVDLFVPLAQTTPHNDQLDEVVDYDFMRRSIAERVQQSHIHLQETLCDDVARMMLTHPKVKAVRVSTEKPDAYPDCESVGVECVPHQD